MRPFSWLDFFLRCCLILTTALPALAQNDAPLALRRAPALARGINLSNWFASSSDLSAAHIAKQVTPVDLKLIHDLGFTYVRIGFDPGQFMANGGFDSAESRAALARLDEAIHEAFNNHLAVSLCLFPNDDYKRQLQGQSGADQFLFLWRRLAQHYASTDADHLFFELINEPEVNDPYRWDGLQAAAVSVIRGVDLAHTIIAHRVVLFRAAGAAEGGTGARWERDLQLPFLRANALHTPGRNMGQL